MTGETSSKSCDIERIEWTYGKGDKQPTVEIEYK